MTVFGTALGNIINRTIIMYEIGGQKIGYVQLDATISENHTRTSKITANEIEDGSNISDNVILENEKFSIEGLISEAPFPSSDVRDIALQIQNKGFGLLSKGIGSISGGLIPDAGATIKRIVALLQLEGFWSNRIPFTVLTGLKKYDNVIIQNMSIPVTYKDGKSLRFKIDCQVLKIVESKTVTIPEEFTKKSGHSSTKKQSLGKQGTSVASERQSSVAYKIFNKFGS